MIDIAKIKELVTLMTENDLSELEIKDDKAGVSIKRGGAQAAPIIQYAAAPAPQHAPAPAAANGVPAAAPTPAGPQASIDSPMVGTCYLAPNPDAAPFVKVGQSVTPDTVVCLIEAMKVFNEIKAEKSGVVEQILVKNGQAVEFGQKIFAVRPS
ncbi:MAG: acetyl-CoA carboxylase biotin carboxyl carrier protein subunit [Phycisphaerae bacterium]|nr:MAG: acetyl-CoA carboxylase biotin carboxyl carrier protein subunit [Phycisphaerae bacterium]